MLRQVIEAPPWSVRYVSPPPLTLHAMLRGTGWIIPDDSTPIRLGSGDIVLARGPGPHTVADAPETAPLVLIHGAGDCSTPHGTPVPEPVPLAPRTYGETCAAPMMMFTGFYPTVTQTAHRLLCALPQVVHLPAADNPRALLAVAVDEIVVDEPGQQVVLDRMLDLLLIRTLRTWFTRPGANSPGWYRALGDKTVGPALHALHERPELPWTVAELAATAGVSRAALARRFTTLVGEPPLTYLTGRRMSLAADLLHDPTTPITTVGQRVGYTDAFAFSTAFKRHHGMPPSAYRATLRS